MSSYRYIYNDATPHCKISTDYREIANCKCESCTSGRNAGLSFSVFETTFIQYLTGQDPKANPEIQQTTNQKGLAQKKT